MLRDKAYEYFITRDLNCSEAVLMAISDEYGLGLDMEDLKLVSGFGRGIGCARFCGVMTALIAACGKMTITGRAHATENFDAVFSGLYDAFVKKIGSAECAELKPVYRKPDVRCLQVVEMGLDVFEEYMASLKQS
jgi:C_GCAxxG_C_C family probable redox protein